MKAKEFIELSKSSKDPAELLKALNTIGGDNVNYSFDGWRYADEADEDDIGKLTAEEAVELQELWMEVENKNHGDGNEWELTVKHVPSATFYKVVGWYSSWGGDDGFSEAEFKQVQAVEKTITVYE